MDLSEMRYTEAVTELERIVAQMQAPDCDIDKLAEYTKRALALLTHCKQKLRTTEEEVKAALEALAPAADPSR